MELERIGFYTLEDARAKNVSVFSPLWRCELLLTSRCNFRCPYCRGVKDDFSGDLSLDDAKHVVDLWSSGGLKNIRFSGGEPTVWRHLPELVGYAKERGIRRIAISTNGYNDVGYYEKLIELGANDFSISLDACCSSTGDMMAGGISGAWNKVISNIKHLSRKTYVTVGVVMTDANISEIEGVIDFASKDLGVADIRILSAAQWNNKAKFQNLYTNFGVLENHPILKYRITNFNHGRNVRGIGESDNHHCPLMLDDMVILGDKHYPCIIHLREHGGAIGSIKNKSITDIRMERFWYMASHDSHQDPICQKNCLDVCVEYNNKVREFQIKQQATRQQRLFI